MNTGWLRYFFLWIGFLIISGILEAQNFHVTTNGSSNGDGSLGSPWDLQTALNHPDKLHAGDTLLIHGGIYRGNFVSSLKGTETDKIWVMAMPGDKVVLDGSTATMGVQQHVLFINGFHTVYKDLEITTNYINRVSTQTGNLPLDIIQVEGITIYGHHIDIVNCVIHNNLGDGIGFWSSEEHSESEIYGCVIFANGFQNPNRGGGHQIYSQNRYGTKYITDNLIFNGFDQGIQVYTEGGSISGYHIEGNIIFNNGVLNRGSVLSRNILIGGVRPASRIVLKNNVLYHSSNKNSSKANLQLGYGVENKDAVVLNNIIVGGNAPFYLAKPWRNLTVSSNTIINLSGTSNSVNANLGDDTSKVEWNNNNYWQGGFNGTTFAEWKSTTRFDSISLFQNMLPVKNQIVVRPNKYEVGRAHVAILNWEKKNEVEVDLSSVLSAGADYKIYDAQNINGSPVAKGRWNGGLIRFPMNVKSIMPPNGNVPTKPVHTDIEFGAFLVTSNSKEKIAPVDNDFDFRLNSFYPSPTVDIVMIELFCSSAVNVAVNVVNSTNDKVFSEMKKTKVGDNKLLLNLSEFQPGKYTVNLKAKERVITFEIVKVEHNVLNTNSGSKNSI